MICLKKKVIEADITILSNETPGVCSVMRKKDEPDRGYAVLGVLKGIQKEHIMLEEGCH